MSDDKQSFWEHLDDLRSVLLRSGAVVLVASLLAFAFKEALFAVLLAPQQSDFVLYRLINHCSDSWNLPSMRLPEFHSVLISTQLTSQFFIHLSAAFSVGCLVASPYIVYELFRFVSPALYAQEKQRLRPAMIGAIGLFFAGVLLNYYLIFPISFRFLATYQVSAEVANTITIASYMQTLLMMSLLMGLLFEVPIVCWFFARLGLLTADFMRRYRKHAIVLIFVVGAVITPTGDVITLSLVALPILLLYEASIVLVNHTQRHRQKRIEAEMKETYGY